jgi:hypothetical protein
LIHVLRKRTDNSTNSKKEEEMLLVGGGYQQNYLCLMMTLISLGIYLLAFDATRNPHMNDV